MPASGSSVNNVFRTIFGSVNWAAPDWLTRLKYTAKTRPGRFWGSLLLLLALLAALVAGYCYYQQLPKPLQVNADVITPELGHYQGDFELQLADSNGNVLGSLAFSVVGAGNITAMLEKMRR